MRIAVTGGGPGGLYFAALWKLRHPAHEIDLFEQNDADSTFGFGVVFSDRALDFLRDDDPETHALVVPHMQHWRDITLQLGGERITIDGIGFSAIGRLALLRLLRRRAETAGIVPQYARPVASLDQLSGYDLIVAADGVNSTLRQELAAQFDVTVTPLANKFAWFGTTTPFNTLTQTFLTTEWGAFNAHHYRYEPDMSTFIVECGPDTWRRAGFETMVAEDQRRHCGAIFADALKGAPLIANRSIWRNFPFIECARWSHGNVVLLGDALHTAHFSIGSGTRLALEDVLALVKALEAEPGDLAAALARYEATRRPLVETLVAASWRSAQWYEDFATHMCLSPAEFAMSYLTRSGRIDEARLAATSPNFFAWYRTQPRAT